MSCAHDGVLVSLIKRNACLVDQMDESGGPDAQGNKPVMDGVAACNSGRTRRLTPGEAERRKVIVGGWGQGEVQQKFMQGKKSHGSVAQRCVSYNNALLFTQTFVKRTDLMLNVLALIRSDNKM